MLSDEIREWLLHALWWLIESGGGDIIANTAYVIAAMFMAYQLVDCYLTAFHRKSGHRLMYDGEPEEYRWRWPKE